MNEQLRDLLAEVLDLTRAEVTPALRRVDTQTWDSLNHLRLITVLETQFGASFTMDEIAQIETPVDLQRIIDSRRPAAPPA